MKALIIYAHPETMGHNTIILKSVKAILKQRNFKHEIIDLYKIKYDPILHEQEHYTSGNKKISDQNLKFQDKIKESKLLIFIFPVWWGTMPAILKGFFEKIFTPGFAYKFEGGIPKKLLKDKKAIVFYTTGGPKIFFWLKGNRPKRNIKYDILRFSGIRSKIIHFANCRKVTDKKIKEIRKKVGSVLRKI